MEEKRKNHQLFIDPFQPELEEGLLVFLKAKKKRTPFPSGRFGRIEPAGPLLAKVPCPEGLSFGLAFHAVMERLDLAGGSNLAELSRVKAMEQFIPGLGEKIETLCRRCLDHPLMKRARKSKRIFREVPFSASLDGNIVEGKIDLLFAEEDRWVIVDYKTMMFPEKRWISVSNPTRNRAPGMPGLSIKRLAGR